MAARESKSILHGIPVTSGIRHGSTRYPGAVTFLFQIIAAARFTKKELDGVDPDKFVIFGVSYGGHIAANALARSDVYATGVSLAGVGDASRRRRRAQASGVRLFCKRRKSLLADDVGEALEVLRALAEPV